MNDKEIEQLIALRQQARLDKDWLESDRIRELLAKNNVVLEDGTNGTTWRRV